METNENEKLESRLQAFHDGTEQRAWEWLGAHRAVKDGKKGVQFCVWAPHAADVSVIHEKSGWARDLAPMTRGGFGILELLPDRHRTLRLL